MRLQRYREYDHAHLGRLERAGDVDGLLNALKSSRIQRSATRRVSIITRLGRVDAMAAVPVIGEILREDKDEGVRRTAAIELGKLGDTAALPALRVALNDPSERVQLWSIRSIGQLRDRQSVEWLILCLADPDWGFRSYAATALGEIGDQRAIASLLPLLSDPKRTVRRSAQKALEALGYESP